MHLQHNYRQLFAFLICFLLNVQRSKLKTSRLENDRIEKIHLAKDQLECFIERHYGHYWSNVAVKGLILDCSNELTCLYKCWENQEKLGCIGISFVGKDKICKLFSKGFSQVRLYGNEDYAAELKSCSPIISNKPKEPKNPAYQSNLLWAEEVPCGKPHFQIKSIAETNTRNRIVGGIEARPHSVPWAVSIQTSEHRCGGSIIQSNRFTNYSDVVVTAGHCVYQQKLLTSTLLQPNVLSVAAGLHNLRYRGQGAQRSVVHRIIVQSKYTGHGHFNDLALLRVKRPFQFTKTVSAVCLPKSRTVLPINQLCLTVGWGHRYERGYYSNTLYQTYVPIKSDSYCKKCYGDLYSAGIMLCAGFEDGGKDSCQGDSGGPLTCQRDGVWQLEGVVSFGFGCARRDTPGIYTRVTSFVDWITEQID
ncbi:Plasma kallikrein [Trichinella spiralis]|uniref:Plasma kallikrein n=1 Tax=Trichinella spiralis TaxID=6334 RepID=A0ABR3KH50_TRISP